MIRFLVLLVAVPLLAACAVERTAEDRVMLVAPTPDGVQVARLCDDGGAGGVLIDGICL